MAPMFLYTQHIVTQSAVCMAPDTLPIRERNRERERERREREREIERERERERDREREREKGIDCAWRD